MADNHPSRMARVPVDPVEGDRINLPLGVVAERSRLTMPERFTVYIYPHLYHRKRGKCTWEAVSIGICQEPHGHWPAGRHLVLRPLKAQRTERFSSLCAHVRNCWNPNAGQIIVTRDPGMGHGEDYRRFDFSALVVSKAVADNAIHLVGQAADATVTWLDDRARALHVVYRAVYDKGAGILDLSSYPLAIEPGGSLSVIVHFLEYRTVRYASRPAADRNRKKETRPSVPGVEGFDAVRFVDLVREQGDIHPAFISPLERLATFAHAVQVTQQAGLSESGRDEAPGDLPGDQTGIIDAVDNLIHEARSRYSTEEVRILRSQIQRWTIRSAADRTAVGPSRALGIVLDLLRLGSSSRRAVPRQARDKDAKLVAAFLRIFDTDLVAEHLVKQLRKDTDPDRWLYALYQLRHGVIRFGDAGLLAETKSLRATLDRVVGGSKIHRAKGDEQLLLSAATLGDEEARDLCLATLDDSESVPFIGSYNAEYESGGYAAAQEGAWRRQAITTDRAYFLRRLHEKIDQHTLQVLELSPFDGVKQPEGWLRARRRQRKR